VVAHPPPRLRFREIERVGAAGALGIRLRRRLRLSLRHRGEAKQTNGDGRKQHVGLCSSTRGFGAGRSTEGDGERGWVDVWWRGRVCANEATKQQRSETVQAVKQLLHSFMDQPFKDLSVLLQSCVVRRSTRTHVPRMARPCTAIPRPGAYIGHALLTVYGGRRFCI
jgi:hypothetical protein